MIIVYGRAAETGMHAVWAQMDAPERNFSGVSELPLPILEYTAKAEGEII